MSRPACEHGTPLAFDCPGCAPRTDRSLEAVAARLRAVAHIPVGDATRDGKHYGLDLCVGDNTLSSIWRCTENYAHPDHGEYVRQGGDVADLYCDSHYPTVDDLAAHAFLINAREDMATLLAALGMQVPLAHE